MDVTGPSCPPRTLRSAFKTRHLDSKFPLPIYFLVFCYLCIRRIASKRQTVHSQSDCPPRTGFDIKMLLSFSWENLLRNWVLLLIRELLRSYNSNNSNRSSPKGAVCQLNVTASYFDLLLSIISKIKYSNSAKSQLKFLDHQQLAALTRNPDYTHVRSKSADIMPRTRQALSKVSESILFRYHL